MIPLSLGIVAALRSFDLLVAPLSSSGVDPGLLSRSSNLGSAWERDLVVVRSGYAPGINGSSN